LIKIDLQGAPNRCNHCMKEYPNLDLLRALAVAFVVLSHLREFVGWSAEADAVFNLDTLGLAGVMIFFVHTTLVLMMSLQRHGAAAAPFLIRRVFRIYPLSVAVVLICSLPRWYVGSLNATELASNLLLIQNITGQASWPQPLWTLPYEMQMYLFLPALYAVSRWPMAAVWLAGISAAAITLAVQPWAKPILLISFAPCFLSGVIAFALSRDAGKLPPVVLFGLVVASAAGLPLLVAKGLPQLPLFWGLCLALGLVIPQCRQIQSLPLTRGASIVATYSYGIYLTHPLALWLGFALPGPLGVKLAASLVALAILSYAAYHGIEKRGIRFGRRLSSVTILSAARRGVAQ
jgi:peptidoglycan/LPS O-acetylase OafA/YrhL